ncbi:hypothetical protein [Pukyongiella litopenaei]|uniref:Uncharacterized protein n=1 Tax=Pukyongiella litopenaei TaxID=2605946 RepID=A0A2S0MQX7_9RHOB|nr:hypothetical protein [Pukyongiella litopenaei]AVO38272.1 hypothetical protein C6Y53_11585 [Pukyongiella litopenaei]
MIQPVQITWPNWMMFVLGNLSRHPVVTTAPNTLGKATGWNRVTIPLQVHIADPPHRFDKLRKALNDVVKDFTDPHKNTAAALVAAFLDGKPA